MKLIVIYILLTSTAMGDQLINYCNEREGFIFRSYKCPKSKLKLPVRTCEYSNELGELQFVNGCSGPSGGFKKNFFKACIAHDLCYHHEPSSNGFSRKDCDQLFLDKALQACELVTKKQKKCQRWAKTMYRSLRVIGGVAFKCADEPASY